MDIIEQNCQLHEEKLENLNTRIDKLEELIAKFTGDDWKEYKTFISNELRVIKKEIEKMDKNHESHEGRISKLEFMFENTIRAINDNSATVKELNQKLTEIAEQLTELKTESRLTDKHLEKNLENKNSNTGVVSKLINNDKVLMSVLLSLVMIIQKLVDYILK